MELKRGEMSRMGKRMGNAYRNLTTFISEICLNIL